MLLAVVTAQTWQEVQRDLRRKMRIDVPGTGIAFTVPLSSIGGKRALGFLTEHQTLTWKEESTLKDTRYELLLVIANQGYTGSIMDAARAAGAGGGTVIHAKGTGMEGAAPFLGMELVNEKELVLIVSRTAQKNRIMKAIMDGADRRAGGHRVLAAGHRHRRSAPAGRGRTGYKIIKKMNILHVCRQKLDKRGVFRYDRRK